LAIGTDGAGSIRIPAAYCNVVGLKPSFGRVPINPPSLFMPHSVIGPMGRKVADVATMLSVLAGPDPRDPYALMSPLRDWSVDDGTSKSLRIAFSPTLGCAKPEEDSESMDLVSAAATTLSDAGWAVETVSPAWPVDPLEPFQVFWEATYAGYLATYPEAQQRLMDPDLLAIGERGRRVDILVYHKALGQRLAMTAAAKAFFETYDVLIGPVMPVPAYPLGRLKPDGAVGEWDWCPYTYPWNMTGQPAISVPCGFTAAGLPVGLQIIAWVGREDLVLQVAAEVERLMPFYQQRPDIQALQV
jgi:aspartyl-tRNA(Asn)/glutamyl-tRNA(Gln) amidotransferase subunit A